MSGVRGPESSPEIARGLSQIVGGALADGASPGSLEAARHLAQLLAMPGLDRLLGALTTHAVGAWPAPLRPVVDQVRRAADACGRDGSIEPLRRLDTELGLIARAIERVPGSSGPDARSAAAERSARATAESAPVPLGEALAGLPLQRANQDLLQRTRLHPSVAGALRAALDWMLGDAEPQLRLWLASDGSALEVTCESVVYANVHAAAEVLANVGAHLGPAGERPGAWTVRVPILTGRDTFLMIEQDELQLAIPWHAVARVRLMPADTIEAMARRQGLPVLAPIAAAPRRAAEQPVIVVALGLKRACLVADRLVWRMAAQPTEPTDAPPAAGVVQAVRSDDGDLYWLLDPAWLLRGVAAPALAGLGGTRPSAPAPPAREPIAPPPPIPFPLQVVRAEPDAAEELEEPSPPTAEPATAGVESAPQTPAAASATAEAPHPAREMPRALVAEDSITARIFLVRLLEQRGFVVHAVRSAAELRSLIAPGPWALICADIDLPDARGGEFMADVVERATAAGAPVVTLVRDADEETMARASGAAATLRKPYEREGLERVMARLLPGLPTRPAPGVADPREWGAR